METKSPSQCNGHLTPLDDSPTRCMCVCKLCFHILKMPKANSQDVHLTRLVSMFEFSRTLFFTLFQDNYSYKYKKILAAFNISCFLLATYLYFRHNKYCEPYGKAEGSLDKFKI